MNQSEQNEILLWIEAEVKKQLHNEGDAVWKGKDSIVEALALAIYGWSYGGPSKFQQREGEPLVSMDEVRDEYILTAKAVMVTLKLLKVQLVQG